MKKILVVDNDRFILEFMRDLLSEEGHEVECAEDASLLWMFWIATPLISYLPIW